MAKHRRIKEYDDVALTTKDVNALGFPMSENYVVRPDSSGTTKEFQGEMEVIKLDDAVTEGAVSHFMMPRDVDLATTNPVIMYCFVRSSAGAGNADIRLQLTCRYVAVTESITKTADETLLITAPIVDTANELQAHVMFTLDRTKMEAADHVSLHLERLGGDGADDFTGSVGLMQDLRFQYDRK